ncbi:MAG: ABC transporter ATP-binding protein [Spirochaetaceae bacterium]|nr:MAG: ABC transporter ATP-binding protein [Spirochaetaceae bacterium]
MQSNTILDVKDLNTWFYTDEGVVKAVNGVDFSIPESTTVCIVGESGCGKSITAQSILNLIEPPGKIVSGSITYRYKDGREVDIVSLKPKGSDIRTIRGKEISMIFQEPMSSLGPVNRIGDQLVQTMLLHLGIDKDEAIKQSIALLDRVGIPKAASRMDSYSFELSGGMRQRVMIALALSCNSRLLIADEPTTALDVTTQANILDLLKELQADFAMSVMFITHDLGVVAEIGHEVVVMYLGQVVERASVEEIFERPLHPYTEALMKSIPKLDFDSHEKLSSIRGMVPHPFARPPGCPFSDRCDYCMPEKCLTANPPLEEVRPGHWVRCVKYSASEEV